MTTDRKRLTLSVTSGLKAELNALKKACYSENTQNEMLRDLIARGLETLKEKGRTEGEDSGRSA